MALAASGTLTGYFQLVNFTQAGSLGLVNDTLSANLTGLGGTLASSLGCAAIQDVTIVLQGASVAALFSGNGTVLGHISSDEIVATPESSTLLVFGTGLLVVGTPLWRPMGNYNQQSAI